MSDKLIWYNKKGKLVAYTSSALVFLGCLCIFFGYWFNNLCMGWSFGIAFFMSAWLVSMQVK